MPKSVSQGHPPGTTPDCGCTAVAARRSQGTRAKGLLLTGLFSLWAGFPAWAAPADPFHQEQEAAVLAARSGQLDTALAELQRLRQEYPQARTLLIDQTLVLAWANQDQRVIDNAPLLDAARDPMQVLAVVAKAYRNLKQFQLGIQWYQAQLQRQPDNQDARLGLVMTLADDNRYPEARAELARLSDPVRLQAEAYVLERQGRKIERLNLYEAMLAHDPGNRETLRRKALLFREMLLPEYALALGERYPGILSSEETQALQADLVALSIRAAAQTFSVQGTEWRNSERSLLRLDSYLETVDPDSTLQRRLRADRLVALVDAGHMQEAVTEYEALLAVGFQPPANLRFAAAQAYLATNQAETARVLLQQCLDETPDKLDCRTEHFYALLELGRLEEAIASADAMLADQVQFDQQTLQANPMHTEARLRAALARSYADRLEESQQELERITEEAPNNASARQELATVYLWRGWPDRALNQYQQVLTIYPAHLGALTGWTSTQLVRQEFRQADQQISKLQKDYPNTPSVQQLARQWSLHEKSELILDASAGNSTGDTFGSRQYSAQGWWYTPPVQDWFRFYAHSFDGFAELPEGNADRPRMAAGVEYRHSEWSARSEISAKRWGGETGLYGEVNWRMNDLWSFAAIAQLNSYDTPLRAYQNDVSSNQLDLRAGFQANEMLSLGGTLTAANFDDGNNRSSIFVYGRQRIMNQPRFKLDATGTLGASRNSLDTASYYNPSQDRSVSVGADMRWLRPLENNRRLYHRLHPQVGSYSQESYGSNSLWSLDYEFGMRFNDSWSMRVGVQRARHAYDGSIEYSNTVLLGLEGRL
ncbi:MAG: poly-beta-1,6 N-acetyl-D-glucosamine export porin PgaA [Gammaproteobacteria bacterium]|nr:poly-beta-1,6 N-acetyl-D-glucosamine export porin PgaA [Gammaproteobacteria bacterium]